MGFSIDRESPRSLSEERWETCNYEVTPFQEDIFVMCSPNTALDSRMAGAYLCDANKPFHIRRRAA